ncbi:MAG: hypothetical protein J6X11_00770 [Treponema sp.]|nr:hypothetical protein [Treponema sp.]
MKKLFAIAVLTVISLAAFAVSYKNNTYQKLAEEYTVKAEKALDAGEYLLAEDYAKKAEENAALSEAFVKRMAARGDAEDAIALAKKRLDYAEKISADKNYPIAYNAATNYYTQATTAFDAEEYETALENAKKVLEALNQIKELIPLPAVYIVRPWAETKDCFWNISGRPYVYNNPYLWENLYEANKNNIPRKNDPNLILPGMKMEIPSLTGEYREGVYSPDTKYEPYAPR